MLSADIPVQQLTQTLEMTYCVEWGVKLYSNQPNADTNPKP